MPLSSSTHQLNFLFFLFFINNIILEKNNFMIKNKYNKLFYKLNFWNKFVLKNGTFSKKDLFSFHCKATIFSINFLNVNRSIAQKPVLTLHLTEAERGALYNNANSPNESPFYNCFFTSPFIIISTIPLSINII